MSKRVLLIIIIFLCSRAAHGQDSAIVLRELAVTASAPPARPSATVQTLSGKHLQALASTTIADALKYFAGVQIKDYGGLGGLKTVNVRSLGAQHVGVYLDGVRIANAQNGTVDLGKYSLSTLESVSLFNGHDNRTTQTASEYASGATVYLRSRRPTNDSISLSGRVGSFHSYGAKALAQFSRPRCSGFVDAEYVNSRGDYPFRYKSEFEDTVGRRTNSDIRFLRIESVLNYRRVSSRLYYYQSERGLPGGIIRRLSGKYVNMGREWDRDMFAQTSYSNLFGRSHRVRLIAKYSRETLRYCTDYPENQNTARVDNHYRLNDAFAAASYNWEAARWLNLTAAYDARMSWMDADLKRFYPVRRFDQKAVVAANAQWRALQMSGSVLFQHLKDYTQLKSGAADPLHRFSPSISASYSFGALSIRAWWKDIFRAPTLNDLYYTQAGNRNLKPEDTRQYNIGLTYYHSGTRWHVSAQADAYINDVSNRIVCLPIKGTYTWSMMNYGRTFCRGLNVNAGAGFSRGDWRLSLRGSLTLQRDLNLTDPDNPNTYRRPICYSPTLSCGVTGVAEWRRLSCSISQLYVSERMWSYASSDDVLAPYSNLDLRLSYRWRRWTASLDVNDLLDIQYEHVPRYPMPGRNFILNIAISIL